MGAEAWANLLRTDLILEDGEVAAAVDAAADVAAEGASPEAVDDGETHEAAA
jgi:hypothetical protein